MGLEEATERRDFQILLQDMTANLLLNLRITSLLLVCWKLGNSSVIVPHKCSEA